MACLSAPQRLEMLKAHAVEMTSTPELEIADIMCDEDRLRRTAIISEHRWWLFFHGKARTVKLVNQKV
ncbi:hypothetical protein ACNKHK_00425 [Shigella flexneri]